MIGSPARANYAGNINKMADVEEPMAVDLSATSEDRTAPKAPQAIRPAKKPGHELPW